MQKTAITSFGAYEYEYYGRNFIETFARYWPKDIRLVVFVEPDTPALGFEWDDRELITEQTGNVPGLSEFLAAVNVFPVLRGETPTGHAIYHDARSGRATFFHHYAAKRFGGKIIWLDADIVTHARVTHEFLDALLPDDKFCAYLGRKEVFSENGFIAFNTEHPIARKFMDAYLSLYTTGSIFLQPGWNDCVAFDRIRVLAQTNHAAAFNNIGEGVEYNRDTQHVFINSVLGEVMDHLKGGRKKLGRSPLSDLAKPRSEPYWQSENVVSVQTR